MATRSNIWLKVNPEDFGKKLKTDISALPVSMSFEHYKYPCEDFTIPKNNHDNELWLGIYCHWDGYPEGVGKVLEENFTKYEDILNLILLGDLSTLCDSIIAYHNWRDEPHKIHVSYNKPNKSDFIDYMYCFENGNWTVTSGYDNWFDK